MLVKIKSLLDAYSRDQMSPGLSVFGKLVPLRLSKQISPCAPQHPDIKHDVDMMSLMHVLVTSYTQQCRGSQF